MNPGCTKPSTLCVTQFGIPLFDVSIMWTSRSFHTYKKIYDFSSSEQGQFTFTALRIDEDDFINMIEALDGEIGKNQVFQTIICDACGTYRCASGNWVAIRRSGRYILFIPAFEEIMGDVDKTECYDPPYLLRKKGSFWLDDSAFVEFKHLVPELDRLDSIVPLSKHELAWLFRWDTPCYLFGEFPSFTPARKEHILVFSDFKNDDAFRILEDLLKKLESCSKFELEEVNPSDAITSAFLNFDFVTECKLFCRSNDTYFLLLGGVFKIVLS
jgi:hypothetical protein